MALSGDYPQGMSLDDALDEIDRLARDNQQLRSDLEDCKDRLIELLQKENDIPEKTIKDALLSIFKSIDSWIDDISGDEKFDFKAQWIKNLQSPNRRENFSVLGLESRCLELEWQVKLGKLETCHYVILSLVISRSLCKDIFRLKEAERWGSAYPLGLEESEVDWLVEIQKSLASEDLGRDQTQIAKWRREAIHGLTATDRFRHASEKRLKEISKDLEYDLRMWAGKDAVSEHFPTLKKRVLEPAIKFLQMIGCSSKDYELALARIIPGPVPIPVASWTVKDITTWRTVSVNDVAGSFHFIYPRLIRIGGPGQEDLVLIKPMLLCYPTLELEPRASRTNSPSPSRHDTSRRLERESSASGNTGLFRRPSPSRHISRPRDSKQTKLRSLTDSSYISNVFGLIRPASVSNQSADSQSPSVRHRRKSRAKQPPTPPSHRDQQLTSDGQIRQDPETIPTAGQVASNYAEGHHEARLTIADNPPQPNGIPQTMYENPGPYEYEDENSMQAAAGYGHGQPNMFSTR